MLMQNLGNLHHISKGMHMTSNGFDKLLSIRSKCHSFHTLPSRSRLFSQPLRLKGGCYANVKLKSYPNQMISIFQKSLRKYCSKTEIKQVTDTLNNSKKSKSTWKDIKRLLSWAKPEKWKLIGITENIYFQITLIFIIMVIYFYSKNKYIRAYIHCHSFVTIVLNFEFLTEWI